MDGFAHLISRLDLVALIGAAHGGTRREGRGLVAVEHPSLTIDPAKGLWTWFSGGPTGPAPGQKYLGGDALDWVALKTVGRIFKECSGHVRDGEKETVLRAACAACGEDFERLFPLQESAASRARAKTAATLAAYMALAVKNVDGTARGLMADRKPYLTELVIERWGIGVAPTASQLRQAGLALDDLLACGLMRVSRHGRERAGDTASPGPMGPSEQPVSSERATGGDGPGRSRAAFGGAGANAPDWKDCYEHFAGKGPRKCFVMPYRRGGRIEYLSSRRLCDVDPRTGEDLPKNKKALCLPSPQAPGAFGVDRPLGFNLDALHAPATREPGVGLLIVEGPLDAIACCERGHPAVGLMTSSIPDGLAAKIRALSGVTVYLALDGTADVTAFKRASVAAALGMTARVCVLPAGKDPDDLAPTQLAALKAEARDVVEECLEVVEP